MMTSPLVQYVECLFEPADLIEVRRLPSKRSTWHAASELPALRDRLAKENCAGQNIYVGANPRCRSGGTAADVALARALFADWDDVMDAVVVRRRWETVGLPEPTLVVYSGHGTHAYWRLTELLTDLAQWSAMQKALIAAVGSDKAIHDPPRIMRLPGFLNVKRKPFEPCVVVAADPTRRYELADLRRILTTQATSMDAQATSGAVERPRSTPASDATIDRARRYVAKIDGAVSGQHGHDRTFHVACVLVQGFNLSPDEAWPVLAEWNQVCQPPWEERDLHRKLAEADKQPGKRGYLLDGASSCVRDKSVAVNQLGIVGGTVAESDWPQIIPFDAVELPPFPTGALPTILREWVEAESHATQTPAHLAGLLALAVCSATIARLVEAEPRPGWREPVNLFVAVLLEPGNRKSAVFADALRPLKELETELIDAARPEVAREQSRRRQAEARLKRLEKKAAEKDDAATGHEAEELAAELAEQPEPVLPRLIVDDATAEKLGMILAEQNGRVASMSPEGGVFDLMAGLYSKSGIPQFGVYLMGHSGDDLVTDRVSRKSVRVRRPALTCAYAMQPQVIAGVAENAAFRGRGLLARFLYAAPASWIGHREIAPEPVSEATREAFHGLVRALAESFGNSGNSSGVFVLNLDVESAVMLRDWERDIEAMLGEGGDMEVMRDWGAKLAGATLRLAALLHCIEYGPAACLSGRTLAAAITIAKSLVPHAEAALGIMQAKELSADADARYVLRWIERHDRREFTKSEAQHHGKRRFPRADDIDPALTELARRGFIRLRPVEPTGPGRPPSPTYDVNPALFADSSAEKRSQYSHNSASEPASGNSGNIGSAFEQSETTNRVRVTI